MPSKADWLALQSAGPIIEQKAAARASEYLRAAALQMDKLTGQPEWDQYLTKMESYRQAAVEAANMAQELLPKQYDDALSRKTQCQYYYQLGLSHAYKRAVELPGKLIAAHKEGQGIPPVPPQDEQDAGVTATDAG